MEALIYDCQFGEYGYNLYDLTWRLLIRKVGSLYIAILSAAKPIHTA